MQSELVNVTEAEIDLLAEGELNSMQREELFRRLDAFPHQWKYCACAVLETQALRRTIVFNPPVATELRPMTERATGDVNQAPQVVRWGRHQTASWMIAAVLLIGISLGTVVGRLSIAAAPTLSARSMDPKLQPLFHATEMAWNRLNIGDEEVLAFVAMENGITPSIVPIVNSPTLVEQAMQLAMARIPKEQIRLANENGWNISQQRILLAKEVATETEIVPLQMVRYRYVGKGVL